ncbi:MAG: amino acid permease [Bacteroidota bacterium]
MGSSNNIKKISKYTAISIVIANMIGTGVFTSLGFQVVDIHSVFSILMLWIVGGFVALFGAFTYGELGAAYPRSGGEYNLLSEIYHPLLGFLSGWVSVTVGFAAPTTLAAIAFASYLQTVFPGIPINHTAAGLVVLFTIIHASSLRLAQVSHNLFTAFKILLIILFIFASYWAVNTQDISVLPKLSDISIIASPGFAVSLIYVSFAYAGWNAAIYVVGEIENAKKNLPVALLVGTVIVTLLYVPLNYVFLKTVAMDALAGQIEIGALSGINIFGETGGQIMAFVIAFLLISTVSGHIFVGPRIMQVMGEDYKVLKFLKTKSKQNIPVAAFVVQLFLILLFLYTSTFEQIMVYSGFTLNLLSTLTVAGVFISRLKDKNIDRPYKTWGYPYTPIIFLIVSIWTLSYVFIERPVESLIGLTIAALGLVVYFYNIKFTRKRMK